MATSLDLQEQEQLDALKAFWKTYGNLITWVLIVGLGAIAAWNGWNWYQRDQGLKSGAMFDELERAVIAGDAGRTGTIAADLRERYPRTAYAQQGALLAAALLHGKGQSDGALGMLAWVGEHGSDDELRTIARLRQAALLAELKRADEALRALDAATAPGLAHLVADRRGDILLGQGKKAEAVAAYKTAWAAMSDKTDYRRFVEAKLMSLGAAPVAADAAGKQGAAAGQASAPR